MADTDPRLFAALPNSGSSISSDDKSWIIREVESGLRNHRPRLAGAIENQAFYDLESDRYQPRREAETEFDFAGRPRRQSGFVQQAVDRLSEHTYNPGPCRTVIGDGLADSLLSQVYETTHIDCVMNHAESQATLNDVCAIQVKCTNLPDKPVDLQLWGGDEFTVFTDPEDPQAVRRRHHRPLQRANSVQALVRGRSADVPHGAVQQRQDFRRGSRSRPRRPRRIPTAAFHSRSCTTALRSASSGRPALALSCARPSCGSTIGSPSSTS